MLTMTFLGVGGAFAKRNFQSNVLVEVWEHAPSQDAPPADSLLIDFGTTGPLALHALKEKPGFAYLKRSGRVNYAALARVFITHLHADHIGGLEEMAIMNTYVCAGDRPQSVHRPQLISTTQILDMLWEKSLRGGLDTMKGRQAHLQDYFAPRPLSLEDPQESWFLLGQRYRAKPFLTDHISISEKHDWPTLGIYIEDTQEGGAVFFSGDSRFDPSAHRVMMGYATVCFHDVQLTGTDDPVHAPLDRLRTLPDEIKRKTWLYHYADDWDQAAYDFVPREFAGFVPPQKRMTVLK